MNCWVPPTDTLAVAGVTVIDCRVTALTINVVEVENAPTTALIVVVPFAIPVAKPPGEVIVATDIFDELHVALEVRSLALPSL